jgi:two-component system sensor histidine kinase AlgZ
MNTIAALTRTNAQAAEQAVEDLADLFRASLRDGRQLIPLREELEIARVYERMEQHRLGNRLQVDWQLGPLPEDTPVPGLVIQPLLENAIYHGIEPMPQPGRIQVSGESAHGSVRISISNPLPPAPSVPRHGNRIALENIRERLELAFGARGVLSVIDTVPGRFTVTIEFPAGQPVLQS